MTERLHFHSSLSCIGEGNGNPLQCSCLENSRDGGAWWAAVYGIAQSRTRLKQLSSSSSVYLKEVLWIRRSQCLPGAADQPHLSHLRAQELWRADQVLTGPGTVHSLTHSLYRSRGLLTLDQLLSGVLGEEQTGAVTAFSFSG